MVRESIEDGAHFTLAQTEPNTNLDAFLATLDGDTRQYIQLLVAGGAQGIGGRGKQLSNALRRFQPFVHYVAKLNKAVAARHVALANVIHNFGRADHRTRAATTPRSSASSPPPTPPSATSPTSRPRSRRRCVEFPAALRAGNAGLASSKRFSDSRLSGADRADPAGAGADPGLQGDRDACSTKTTAPIRDQIRPFTREIRPVLTHANEGAGPLSKTVRNFGNALGGFNTFLNELAYKPKGSKESFLFYLPWLNHNFNASFNLQDAGGPVLRSLVLHFLHRRRPRLRCRRSIKPFLKTLLQVTNIPRQDRNPRTRQPVEPNRPVRIRP